LFPIATPDGKDVHFTHYRIAFGKWGQNLDRVFRGKLAPTTFDRIPLRANKWYRVRIAKRQSGIRYWVDNRSFRLSTIDMKNVGTAVGFMTSQVAARFKNIKVKRPSGAVLWEGLPKLP
jgi:hypothetical protein